jgi:hypothetical protein
MSTTSRSTGESLHRVSNNEIHIRKGRSHDSEKFDLQHLGSEAFGQLHFSMPWFHRLAFERRLNIPCQRLYHSCSYFSSSRGGTAVYCV